MRKHVFLLFSSFLLFTTYTINGKTILLPVPQQIDWNKETFLVREAALSSDFIPDDFLSLWNELGGTTSDKASCKINIHKIPSITQAKVNQEEAYTLAVTKKEILIEATSEKGVFNAIQTLRQLAIPSKKNTHIAGCKIIDWPAFRIRGFMHDTGRGYISVEELKREIAILSRYKINVFHWHLTEDLGWRLESKLFPMLNDSANFGRMPGKMYTIVQAKELIAWCKQHHVLLIPEIEMPGHSTAFRKTFRHDMQSKEGMAILKLLIDEICEIFEEVPYLHIGTDEVPFTNPSFVPEMVNHVRSKGKKAISWNPGWNYKAGEIDMLQMWSYRGKPHKGIPVIDSRLHYLNHYDTFADIVGLYNSNIAGQQQGSPDFAGTILAVWNDRFVSSEENIILENAFYPSMLAMAERAWLGGGDKYWDEEGCIMNEEGSDAFNAFADFEKRMLWHKENHFRGYPFAYVRQANVNWRITDAFPNNGDLQKSFPPEKELQTSYIYNGTTYESKIAIGAGIYLRHVWGKIVPAFYSDPQPNHTAYAYTWVYSPKAQESGLWVEFQNYGRSEKDLPPPSGKWDYKGSRIWVNDTEIQPPAWTATHTEKSNETPLGNENCVARPPLTVQLNKGWNKVLLKLPIGQFSTTEVRLQKWMFTVVFVTPNGKKATDGLIYSPDKTM